MEWLLVLAFIGVIGYLMYKLSHDRESDVPINDYPEKCPEEEMPIAKKVDYTSIYEYVKTKTVSRCPFCDAENDLSARICDICGNRMES